MASYPSAIALFPTHVNITEIIDASHPNNIQGEVVAIQTELGLNPATSTTPSPSGTFVATSTAFADLVARLANIETGIVSDAHNQYIRKAGDTANIITPAASTTKGLVIKAAGGQTANLQEWQDSTSTVVTRIDSSGALIGTASGNVALSTVTTAGDLIVGTGSAAVSRLASGAQGTALYSNGSVLYWAAPIQGTTGSQGIQGVQGAQGTTGIQGNTGTQGTQGVQGNQGAQGQTGTQGQVGSQGTQGLLGLQGIAGAVAAQGIQGPSGTQGAQGSNGAQGITGTGSQGVQGFFGPQGIQGTLGTQGIQGITGFAAAQGWTGPQGTQGVQGTTGIQGFQGIQGGGFNQLQGTQGIQGPEGAAGAGSGISELLLIGA
jgi:hypothetical protein